MRHLSAAGLQLIKDSEGCRLKAYKDQAGVWTIGYGATVWYDGTSIKRGMTCTQAAADGLLQRDIASSVQCVDEHLVKGLNVRNPNGALVYVPMPQSVFDGQVSLCYNIGEAAWKKSTQLRNLNSGAYIKWEKEKS